MSPQDLPSNFSRPAKHILHPTDFTRESDLALAHALRLALTNRADVHLLHVGQGRHESWDEFPSIRQFLHRWGLVPEDASQSDVTDLGIGISKVISKASSVAGAISAYCQRHPIDLIVLATAGRDGLASWLRPSEAERIAEEVSSLLIPTLFVPAKCRGCVAIDSGRVSTDHVLVPVDHRPHSEAAVEHGLRAISIYGSEQAHLTMLHVGSESAFPRVQISPGPWKIERLVKQGNAAAEIVKVAEESEANLIIMVTEGTEGFLDVFRGTTTAQVLRHAPCPVLAIPTQD